MCQRRPSVLPRFVVLPFEPWGHIYHAGSDCVSSPLLSPQDVITGEGGGVSSGEEITSDSSVLVSTEIHSVRPGSVSIVSRRASPYGRQLLATYERMMTGGLSACDWLTPVTCGGWRLAPPVDAGEIVTSAD